MTSKKNTSLHNINSENSKFNFSHKKETAINSLFEIEQFLCEFKNIWKYIKLYKIFK